MREVFNAWAKNQGFSSDRNEEECAWEGWQACWDYLHSYKHPEKNVCKGEWTEVGKKAIRVWAEEAVKDLSPQQREERGAENSTGAHDFQPQKSEVAHFYAGVKHDASYVDLPDDHFD